MQNHGDVMDPALASLIEDLAASGKLATTMVIMLSEFGRTPRINDNAGRDHHARCFSCFMAGGGIKGGQVIGKSDEDAMRPAERPVNPHDLHATVCHAMGIDYEKKYDDALVRLEALKILDKKADADIAQRRGRLAKLDDELSAADKSLHEAHSSLAACEQVCERLKSDHRAIDTSIGVEDARIYSLNGQIVASEKQLTELENDKAKLTRFLKRISKQSPLGLKTAFLFHKIQKL